MQWGTPPSSTRSVVLEMPEAQDRDMRDITQLQIVQRFAAPVFVEHQTCLGNNSVTYPDASQR